MGDGTLGSGAAGSGGGTGAAFFSSQDVGDPVDPPKEHRKAPSPETSKGPDNLPPLGGLQDTGLVNGSTEELSR